jgi:tetratricopeptide (TPR) repeat protein
MSCFLKNKRQIGTQLKKLWTKTKEVIMLSNLYLCCMKYIPFFKITVLCLILATSLCCKSSTKPVGDDLVVETDQTILLLDSLIKANPRNPDYYYDRALYYKSIGINPKAVVDIYSALHIDSANVSYYLFAGELFLDMGEGEKAIALTAKGINMVPGNEALYIKAIAYNYYMQQYEAALNFANDLIGINKYNAEAYFLKGLIYKETGQENKAISALQTCTEVDPAFYNAYMQLGLIYSKQKDDVAVQYFENAMRLKEGSREAYYAIAYHYQRKKEFSRAILEYKKMIASNPKDHEVFFNLGHCYIGLDSLHKAYNHFDLAIKIQPQYAGAYYMKGNISEGLGNDEDALKNYQQALNMLPEDSVIMAAVRRVGK